MFEQLVRPFAARSVTTTRRIVPTVISAPIVETAILSWGKAGTVALGVQQPDGTELKNVDSGGFRLHSCHETWNQKSVATKEKEIPIKTAGGTTIGTTTVDRITEIGFSRREAETQPFSYAAVGVASVIAGLRRDIPGSNSCEATYKLKYDD